MMSPSETLAAFMKEMHDWEERCYQRSEQSIAGKLPFDEAAAIGTREYLSIYGKYCSAKKGKPRDFFYDHPPDYDADGEKITNFQLLSDEIAEVHTHQQYTYKKHHIYRLCREKDGWRLFEKYIVLEDNNPLKTDL